MVSERPRQKTISAELAGLNDDEVKASREKNGENRLSTPKQRSFMKQFFSNLGDPVTRILLFALILNIIFLVLGGDIYETV